jgi:hypothetical protein
VGGRSVCGARRPGAWRLVRQPRRPRASRGGPTTSRTSQAPTRRRAARAARQQLVGPPVDGREGSCQAGADPATSGTCATGPAGQRGHMEPIRRLRLVAVAAEAEPRPGSGSSALDNVRNESAYRRACLRTSALVSRQSSRSACLSTGSPVCVDHPGGAMCSRSASVRRELMLPRNAAGRVTIEPTGARPAPAVGTGSDGDGTDEIIARMLGGRPRHNPRLYAGPTATTVAISPVRPRACRHSRAIAFGMPDISCDTPRSAPL